MQDILPRTSDIVSKHPDADYRRVFGDYLHNITYHLENAHMFSGLSSKTVLNAPLSEVDGKSVAVSVDLSQVIVFGDMAIREVFSTLEMCLGVLNHLLALKFPNQELMWKYEIEDKQSFRTIMVDKGYVNLVRLIDSMRNSIGYDLLSKYRHWIEHRGAPRIYADIDFQKPLQLTDEVLACDETESMFKIRSFLDTKIPDSIRVFCYPFVPPVNTLVNLKIDNAEEDIFLPGIFIGKGSKDIIIRDSAYSQGSLFENSKDYRKKNAVELAKNKKKIAGEKLVEYSFWSYTTGIQTTLMFAREFVSQRLDVELQAILRYRGEFK